MRETAMGEATPRFRAIAAADLGEAVGLWHRAWHDAHAALLPASIVRERSLETFERRMATLEKRAFVATHEDEVIAFAALVGDEVDQFYLDRQARGTGVAMLFLSMLEGELADGGTRDAFVECLDGNARARAFYAKCGWTSLGTMDRPVWTADGRSECYPVSRFTKRLGP